MKTELSTEEVIDNIVRALRCDLGWFDASHAWLASDSCPEPRPLSLGSLEALRFMGIDFDACEFDTREIAIYRWLHIAPLHVVKAAIWSGAWHDLFVDAGPLAEEVVAAFRAERKIIAEIIAAATVSIRAKPPPKGGMGTPPDVIAPTLTTFRICTIAAHIRADIEQVRWHLPLVQALQIYHAALWESGRWTVVPGKQATAAELEDMMPEEMTEGFDTTPSACG